MLQSVLTLIPLLFFPPRLPDIFDDVIAYKIDKKFSPLRTYLSINFFKKNRATLS